MDNHSQKDRSELFKSTVKKKIARHHKGKKKRNQLLFSMGMFGLVGWTVAIYTIIGVLVGTWLDKHIVSDVSWTLTMIILGLIAGIVSAWIWISRELDDD